MEITEHKKNKKYIFVTGGVVSGLGKGIINILAVKNEGEFNIAISPDTYLEENSKLLVLGEYRALQKCFRI